MFSVLLGICLREELLGHGDSNFMFLSAMYEVSNFSIFSPTLVFLLYVETSFLILPKLKND